MVPATTARPAPDPLFVFAGGPGQAGTDFGPWLTTAFAPVRRTRDVVLVDFRGTGRSGALAARCPDLLAAAELCRGGRIGAGLRPREGRAFYTHREVVEDIERVRLALGYEQINLWGGSFGTRIAQHYVRKYGAHVRSVVLDGATPVGTSIFASAPRTAEEALQRLFADCAADAVARALFRCAEELAALLARAEAEVSAERRRPAPTGRTPVALDRDVVVGLCAARCTSMAHALAAARDRRSARGRLEPLVALGAATGEWSTNTMAFGFTLGIVCSEDLAQSRRSVAARLSAGFVRDSYYRGFAVTCEWPTAPLPADDARADRDGLPALAISGEADPVTPPSLGDAALAQFAPRVHAIVPGGYHTNSSNPCVAAIIAAFVADPAHGGRNHDCLRGAAAPARFYIGDARDRSDDRRHRPDETLRQDRRRRADRL